MTQKKEWSQRKADGMLMLATVAWGSSYLLMALGLDSMGSFSLMTLRFAIAFAALTVIFWKRIRTTTRRTLRYGAILGTLIYLAFTFITHSLGMTSVSNASFLNSTAVVIVPILHAVILRKMPDKSVIAGCLLAISGIGFMSLEGSFAFHTGDIYALAGAFFYACQILTSSHAARREEGILLGYWQIGFAMILSLVSAFLFETPTLPGSTSGWLAVLGLGLICSAFGFTVQTTVQKYTTPEHTGLLLSLEPVFSAIFAYLFAGETMTGKQLFGAVLVLSGVIVTSVLSSLAEQKTDTLESRAA